MRGVRTYVVHMRVIFLHVYVIRNAAKMVMCSLSQKQPTQQKSNIAIVSGLKTINSRERTLATYIRFLGSLVEGNNHMSSTPIKPSHALSG